MSWIKQEEVSVCSVCEGQKWLIDDENIELEEGDSGGYLKEICFNCKGTGEAPTES